LIVRVQVVGLDTADHSKSILMSLQRWHWGKILILWIATPVVMLISLGLLFGETDLSDGVMFLLSLFLPPVLMSIVTWVWLSGKEKRRYRNELKRN